MSVRVEFAPYQASALLAFLMGENAGRVAQDPAAEIVFLAIKRLAVALADYADACAVEVANAPPPPEAKAKPKRGRPAGSRTRTRKPAAPPDPAQTAIPGALEGGAA